MVRPAGCRICPLDKKAEGFVQLTLPADFSNVKLLVQGEAPGRTEIEQGKAFAGKAGHWQRHNIISNAGLDADMEVSYDNTLRCLPPENKQGEHYPVGEDRIAAERCCRQYDRWTLYPQAVPLLLVGNKALNQVEGHEQISEWHGHITIHNGRLIGCTYHPSAVMRQPNLLPVVIKETANLLQAAKAPLEALRRPVVHKV